MKYLLILSIVLMSFVIYPLKKEQKDSIEKVQLMNKWVRDFNYFPLKSKPLSLDIDIDSFTSYIGDKYVYKTEVPFPRFPNILNKPSDISWNNYIIIIKIYIK